jgi:hypothetical protein
MCNPKHLNSVDIGLKSEAEATDFLRRMQTSAVVPKEGKLKKRALSRTEKRVLQQEKVRFKVLLEVESARNGLML